jgi:transcriptional regulator with XRE-family HTH domain
MDKGASRIRGLRTLAGLTQFGLAKKTRIKRSRLSLVANGQMRLRLTEDERARCDRKCAKAGGARSRLF